MKAPALVVAFSFLCLCSCSGPEAQQAAARNDDPPPLKELRVEPVGKMMTSLDEVTAPGKVELDPGRLSKLTLAMPGRVAEVLVSLGSAVDRGMPVIRLDSPDTGTAVSSYRQAQAKTLQSKSSVAKAEADLSREQDLLSHGAVAEKDVLSARASLVQAQSDLAQANAAEEEAAEKLRIFGIDSGGKHTNRVVLNAPVSGKVLDLNVVAGEYRTDTSAPLMTIADLSTVFMTADVPEQYVRLVKAGDEVKLKLDAYPGETFRGRVFRVADTVDATTRTIKVRIKLQNASERFRPDMFGQMAIAGPAIAAISVPAASLVQTPERALVYRESGPGKYEPVTVTTGQTTDGRVAILSGLAEGDRVVTDGAMLLRAGSR
jgi:membrane fusion protein, heavy metal efflux system